MGPEVLAALALSGGGALIQNQAQQDAADERRAILNRNMERDAAASDKATALVQDEGKNYSMDQRVQQLAANEDKAYNQAQTDIAGAGGSLVDTAGDAGNVSADFLKDKAARAVDEGTRLTSIARESAKGRAAGGLLNDDALRKANLAGNLQNLWGSTKNMDTATSNDAASVQTPGYGILGSIASAAGTSMLAGNALNGLGKYAGSSANPFAANYVNSLDSGIRW